MHGGGSREGGGTFQLMAVKDFSKGRQVVRHF